MKLEKFPRTTVVIGASSAYGVGDRSGGGFAGRIKKFVENVDSRNKLYNLGIIGDTSRGILQRSQAEVSLRKPELIILHVGANECKRIDSPENPPQISLSESKENVVKILNTLGAIAPVIVCGIHPINEQKTSPVGDSNNYYLLYDLIEYENATKEICQSLNVEYLDMMSEMLKIDYKILLSADGLHLNYKGYSLVFDKIQKLLLPLVRAN